MVFQVPQTVEEIGERYNEVLAHIARAAHLVGRNPDDVRLMVVTKTHSPEIVTAAVRAGARFLGENYAEEALAKKRAVHEALGVEWHMIGHVQSRKAEVVAQNFACVHSLDSLKLAARLDRFAAQAGRVLPVLLECNVSGEASKYGFRASDEASWELLLPDFEKVAALPNLSLRGLMTMAPFLPDAEGARPCFRRLRSLRDFLRRRLPKVDWCELSMGMSADFEVAVQEGATWVRVGQAIFGAR
ncbi:MAG: YggS family pyridoxal phosphate-dependent enzyme [Chloroflexota bacterium]